MSAPLNLLDLFFRDKAPVLVCDVGAADGEDTEVYARHFPMPRVFAFEPVPAHLTALHQRVAPFGSYVTVLPYVLSDVAADHTPFWRSYADASINCG